MKPETVKNPMQGLVTKQGTSIVEGIVSLLALLPILYAVVVSQLPNNDGSYIELNGAWKIEKALSSAQEPSASDAVKIPGGFSTEGFAGTKVVLSRDFSLTEKMRACVLTLQLC